MTWINHGLGGLVGAVLSPFRLLPPIVGLSVVSLLAAIGMLLVFRATSNQPAIADVKRRSTQAFSKSGCSTMTSGRCSPRSWTSCGTTSHTCGCRWRRCCGCSFRSCCSSRSCSSTTVTTASSPGQSAVVKVRLKQGASPPSGAAPALALEAPSGLRVQTPLVWIPSEREAAWRIGTEKPGDYHLTVRLDGTSATKLVRVSEQVGWRTPERLEAGFLNEVLYPAEAPIEANVPIESIELAYPEREISLFGYPVHWMIAFFALSLVFAFALKSRFGVVI